MGEAELLYPKRQLIIHSDFIFYGDAASPETDKLWRLCRRSRLSLGDLINGLTFSANSEQVGLLGWLQEEVRSQCALVQQGMSHGGCP